MKNKSDFRNLPTVSVVIPTYNRASCISEAIESVLLQTYPAYEIIVVDDGSIDETRQVLSTFGTQLIYIFQENQGVSSARNTGVRQATGEWVAFLDSDDEWLPNKLARQIDCINHYPQSIGVTCDVEIVNNKNSISLFELRNNYLANSSKCHFLKRPLLDVLSAKFFTSTLVFKKSSMLAIGGYNESISLYEDIDFSARFSLDGAWCVVPEVLVKILRKTTDNLSIQHVADPTRSPRNLTYIYDHLLSMSSLDAREKKQLKKNCSGQHFLLGVELIKANSRTEGILHIKQAFKTHPSLRNLIKWILLILFPSHVYSSITNFFSKRKNYLRRSEIN